MSSFIDFYRLRRGRDPFPWMVRLAERFVSGSLPDAVDLPTGSGKTEIALIWWWARTANLALPRRLWIASDRRVIVDQTYCAASSLTEEDSSLLVSRLRGGIVLDDEEMLDPVRPQILCSTVDQLGSRLLFRAYGASPRTWPIWAGLAGNDSLIVLDEAHLSPTAEETFRACRNMGAGIHVISMTATPRPGAADVFRLDGEDRAHPVLRRRLTANRVVELRAGGSPVSAVEELLAEGCKRIAVVCNTVRRARQVFAALTLVDKYLLIGRQRPLDRDGILAGLLPSVMSGAPEPDEPLVVVATQCIEAGADFDFDGMVTELCPVDALRQRLGRLDRLGFLGESRCILVAPEKPEPVPPYGEPLCATWNWLNKVAKKKKIDLGAESWVSLGPSVPADALSARAETVDFFDPQVRMLTRTAPRPVVEPGPCGSSWPGRQGRA